LERYPGPKFRLDSASAFDDARNALAAGEAPVIASSATESDRDPGAAERIERCFGELARRAVAELGISDLIVAGGETSGAVVEALGIIAAEVTGIVAAGVPSLRTLGDPSVRLVLKSGNFGGPDFFADALKHLEHR